MITTRSATLSVLALLIGASAGQSSLDPMSDGRYADLVLQDFKWAIPGKFMDFDIYRDDDDSEPQFLTECRLYTTARPTDKTPCEKPEYEVSFAPGGYKGPGKPFNLVVVHKMEMKNAYKKTFVVQPQYFNCSGCVAYPLLPKVPGSDKKPALNGIFKRIRDWLPF